MSTHLPATWEFVLTARQTWTWHNTTVRSQSEFTKLDAAMVDAASQGFDQSRDYWIVHKDGRATHFRPGKPGVNLPNGEVPK
jgi:hypothetical protein